MVTGVGTDLIEKERVLKAIERPSFLQSVYTEAEQQMIAHRRQFAVSNFAAKEAVTKAFGTGFCGIRPDEIEILRYPSGQPYVVLHGAAEKKAAELGVERIQLSITDTDRLTQAFAVLEGGCHPAVFGSEPEHYCLEGMHSSAEQRLPLLTAAAMKEVDRRTIEIEGIPSLTLMERAAEQVTARVLVHASQTTRIGVLCGTGNNGGDGLCVARQLQGRGFQAVVYLKQAEQWQTLGWQLAKNAETPPEELMQPGSCTKEFLVQLVRALQAGVRFSELCQAGRDTCDLLVDALFGIGLTREITGEYQRVLQQLLEEKLPVIAVDIASGICADTGKVRGIALPAMETVTFGAAKCGHLFYPGKEYTGQLFVAEIGFPEKLLWDKREAFYFQTGALEKRPAYSNKGIFGKVALFAGCKNMAGAAYLSACAAGKSGAGLVRIVTPECNREILQTRLPEAMLTTYAEKEEWSETQAEVERAVKEAVSFATAVGIGPGLGRSRTAGFLVQRVAEELKQLGERAPVSVWDADALNLLSERMDEAGAKTRTERLAFLREYLPEHAVLTPHPGELARLLQEPAKELLACLLPTAKELVRDNSLVFVVKDAVTVVAEKEECFVQTAGNSGMATGGSGDVLTGVIAALAANGTAAFEAAVHGVWLHGMAGDWAAGCLGEASVMAGDIAFALQELLVQPEENRKEMSRHRTATGDIS